MSLDKVKSLFLKSLIACLVAAAGLAVVSVLIGSFNDVCIKALATIALVAAHCLLSFGFIVNNEKQETFDSLTFFSNATFTIIVLSFITSVFGVWGILSGDLVGRLYAVYVILLFAVLHGEILAKSLGKQSSIDTIVRFNYVFMAIVVVMLMPVVFLPTGESLGDIYYRFLAAAGIIDATLTLVAIILHKLYLHKHPQTNDALFNFAPPTQVGVQSPQTLPHKPSTARRITNIFVIVLVCYVVFQLVVGLVVIVGLRGLKH